MRDVSVGVMQSLCQLWFPVNECSQSPRQSQAVCVCGCMCVAVGEYICVNLGRY